MNTYYELTAEIDGFKEVIFGSFLRREVEEERDAERDSLREQGYEKIKIESRSTADEPCSTVYDADEMREIDGVDDDSDDSDSGFVDPDTIAAEQALGGRVAHVQHVEGVTFAAFTASRVVRLESGADLEPDFVQRGAFTDDETAKLKAWYYKHLAGMLRIILRRIVAHHGGARIMTDERAISTVNEAVMQVVNDYLARIGGADSQLFQEWERAEVAALRVEFCEYLTGEE